MTYLKIIRKERRKEGLQKMPSHLPTVLILYDPLAEMSWRIFQYVMIVRNLKYIINMPNGTLKSCHMIKEIIKVLHY